MVRKVKQENFVLPAGMAGMKGLVPLMRMAMMKEEAQPEYNFPEIKWNDNNKSKIVSYICDRFKLMQVTIEQIGRWDK